MALKHVYYHVRNESPVYVRCRIQDAWGWCTGMIQRDNIGWEVGGGVHVWELIKKKKKDMFIILKFRKYKGVLG